MHGQKANADEALRNHFFAEVRDAETHTPVQCGLKRVRGATSGCSDMLLVLLGVHSFNSRVDFTAATSDTTKTRVSGKGGR